MFIWKQKIKIILSIFLEILQRYCMLFLFTLGSLVTHTKNNSIILQKTFLFICKQKNYFIIHVFLEMFKRYANFLLWVLQAFLDTHTQDGNIILQKISMFLYVTKINFFLEILHFKESCSSIGQQQLKNQNFVKYVIRGEISITIVFFILAYFQEN